MKGKRIGNRIIALILTVFVLSAACGAFAEAAGKPAVALSDCVEWGDYGRAQLTEVTVWTNDLAELYYTDATPEGKWALVIFTILDGKEFPTDALNLALDCLRLDEYTVARCSAHGATQYSDGTLMLNGTMAFFIDVPPDYDPAQGVVTFNNPVHDIQWGEYGRVRLTEITEWTSDLAELYYTDATPEGKWALVIFTILDGSEFPLDALNLALDSLLLDEYAVARCSAHGATQYADGTIMLNGTMAFFIDVPLDYDPAEGVVTVDGIVMTVAEE